MILTDLELTSFRTTEDLVPRGILNSEGMTYFEGPFVVLDASVQVDAALGHSSLLIFTAIG